MSTFKESMLIPKESFLRLTSEGKIRKKNVNIPKGQKKSRPSTRYILYEAKRARRRDKARNSAGTAMETPRNFAPDMEQTRSPDPYEKHILKWFSPEHQSAIFRIVKAMRKYPDVVHWDEENFELTISDRYLPGSNLIDILTFLVTGEDEDRYYSSANYDQGNRARGVPEHTHKFVVVMNKIFDMADNSEKLYAALRFNPKKVEKAKERNQARFREMEDLVGKPRDPERLMRRSMDAITELEMERTPLLASTVGERLKQTQAKSEGATPKRSVGRFFSDSFKDAKRLLFSSPAAQQEDEAENVADELPTVGERVMKYRTRRPEQRRPPIKYSPI